MGAAAYIGRVGGLAVALGVGTAIATGYGVASAEEADSPSPPNSSTTDQSQTGGSTTSNTTTGTTTTTQTSGTDGTAATSPNTTTNTTTDTVADGSVSAQTNTGSLGSTETTESPDEPDTPDEPEPDPTEVPTEDPEPTETADPPPTDTEEEPTAPEEEPVGGGASNSGHNNSGASPSAADPTTTPSARTIESLPDPATAIQQADHVAVFADARALASVSPTNVSPMMAAQVARSAEAQPTASVAPAPQDLYAAVTNVVSSVVNWVLNPLAGTAPTSPAQPPLIWGLLAFARREFENFFAALGARTAENAALAVTQTTNSLALAAAAVPVNPSPSTRFVGWVTGNFDPNNTSARYSVWGTDIGTMWDNGIPDDPATPINEHQVLIAVGDTFSEPNSVGWRPNTLFRSSDTDLTNGMTIPDGQWFNGNMFGGAPLSSPTFARQSIPAGGLPAGITLIPTAGISLPTPGTRFGSTQYVSFMSVTQWGAPGQWTTNYSAIAYSVDNGENWTVAPTSVRYNQPWTGNQNFQQSAFVRPGDGYVYMYGTPNGRQGAAYVSRVVENDILDVTKYDYYRKAQSGWFWSTPAGWHRNNPAAATPVFGQDRGACGIANVGNQVSEMSVQYNKQLNKYVVLHGDQFNNIVMRTADRPEGTWSTAKVLMPQQSGGIYAPMMHPWSPSTMGTGSDLYWNLSLWSEYNVMLMRTDLTKV